MSSLNRAIVIAAEAHAGDEDKGGHPYILHPLRLMLACTAEQERIVAVLHDVVEDSDWTLEGLAAEGFDAEVIAALDCLTKRDDEDYTTFIARVAENGLARAVKIQDLLDNSDLSRIANPGDEDRERVGKYRRALEVLRG